MKKNPKVRSVCDEIYTPRVSITSDLQLDLLILSLSLLHLIPALLLILLPLLPLIQLLSMQTSKTSGTSQLTRSDAQS
jgi:hypothetical protein